MTVAEMAAKSADLLGRRRAATGIAVAAAVYFLRNWGDVGKAFLKIFHLRSRFSFPLRVLDLLATVVFRLVGLNGPASRSGFSRLKWNFVQKMFLDVGVGKDARTVWQDFSVPAEPPCKFEPKGAPALPVRIYSQRGQDKKVPRKSVPVIVFYHGGGFVLCSNKQIDYHYRLKTLAGKHGFVIASCEYRLAPEHPFPNAIVDAHRALQWVVEQGDLSGALPPQADAEQIILMGDSAGGNLCTVVASLVRDSLDGHLRSMEFAKKKVRVLHQVVIYACLFLFEETVSAAEWRSGTPLLSGPLQDFFWSAYLPDSILQDAKVDRRCSPWLAGLQGLPPTTVVTASICPFLDENRTYVEKLRENGVKVTMWHFEDIHGFFTTNFNMNTEDCMSCIVQDLGQYLPQQKAEFIR